MNDTRVIKYNNHTSLLFYSVMTVYLDIPLLIDPSVFSRVYLLQHTCVILLIFWIVYEIMHNQYKIHKLNNI